MFDMNEWMNEWMNISLKVISFCVDDFGLDMSIISLEVVKLCGLNCNLLWYFLQGREVSPEGGVVDGGDWWVSIE